MWKISQTAATPKNKNVTLDSQHGSYYHFQASDKDVIHILALTILGCTPQGPRRPRFPETMGMYFPKHPPLGSVRIHYHMCMLPGKICMDVKLCGPNIWNKYTFQFSQELYVEWHNWRFFLICGK